MLCVYSNGYIETQSLGRDAYLSLKAVGRMGVCLIRNEKGRKLIPNGTQSPLDRATQHLCIQHVQHTPDLRQVYKEKANKDDACCDFFCDETHTYMRVRWLTCGGRKGGYVLGKTREERRKGQGRRRRGWHRSPTSTQMEIICVSKRGLVHIQLKQSLCGAMHSP